MAGRAPASSPEEAWKQARLAYPPGPSGHNSTREHTPLPQVDPFPDVPEVIDDLYVMEKIVEKIEQIASDFYDHVEVVKRQQELLRSMVSSQKVATRQIGELVLRHAELRSTLEDHERRLATVDALPTKSFVAIAFVTFIVLVLLVGILIVMGLSLK
ncbi:hypothetical protein M426DRAFT_266220 [Hypoxylon sp. CI-4A]|nr:hypothetical protein M426DRAFT_266220 [Hypoxylon sp. CI-4A]